jgi:ATP synthase protein I
LGLESFVTDRKFSTVVKILGYQVLVTIIITLGFAVADGWQKALSPALGGLAAFIPNFYFALRIYRSAGQEARKIVRSFYAGESGKLLLTGALFAMIFQIPNIQLLPLFAAYAAALSVFWFALLMR